MEKLNKIERKIEAIEKRNKLVELDKAWETSKTRAIAIIVIRSYLVGVKNYLQNALIPTVAFFISIQSLPMIKRWRLKKYEQ